MRAVLDTNILVDYLNGVDAATEEIAEYATPQVSMITWMEVLVGARDDDEDAAIRGFLARFEVLEIDRATAEEAVQLRRAHGLRLPDAIIWATARVRDALFVTRNTRDFPPSDPGVRVPYDL